MQTFYKIIDKNFEIQNLLSSLIIISLKIWSEQEQIKANIAVKN